MLRCGACVHERGWRDFEAPASYRHAQVLCGTTRPPGTTCKSRPFKRLQDSLEAVPSACWPHAVPSCWSFRQRAGAVWKKEAALTSSLVFLKETSLAHPGSCKLDLSASVTEEGESPLEPGVPTEATPGHWEACL